MCGEGWQLGREVRLSSEYKDQGLIGKEQDLQVESSQEETARLWQSLIRPAQ